ncbi:MAG: roadblock/LC7 domain-containing protein [Candidatus Hodarchaeota archaeon]
MTRKVTHEDLDELLNLMNRTGNFKASLISTDQGLVISSAVSATTNEGATAAMAPAIHATVAQVIQDLGMGRIYDIVVRSEKGTLVLKSFKVDDERFILTVIAPPLPPLNEVISEGVSRVRSILSKLGIT